MLTKAPGMHFEFSNAEQCINGQHYAICDKCGILHKSNTGFAIEVACRGSYYRIRHKLCSRCAGIYLKAFFPLISIASMSNKLSNYSEGYNLICKAQSEIKKIKRELEKELSVAREGKQ